MASAMAVTPVKSPLLQRREPFAERASPMKFITPIRSSPKPPRLRSTPQGDRFIPRRSAIDFEVARFNLSARKCQKTPEKTAGTPSQSKENYQRQLADNFLTKGSKSGQKSRILAFQQKPPTAQNIFSETRPSDSASRAPAPPFRKVPQKEERVLDAPELLNDHYFSLLDWSSTDVIAVALGSAVYLFNVVTNESTVLMEAEADAYITSLSWAPDSSHIAVGLSSNTVQMWDSTRACKVRTLIGHTARVGCLSWREATTTLSSGSLDTTVINHDVRIKEHIVSSMTPHTREVCGLKWSLSGRQLASGGKDSNLFIWDAAKGSLSSAGSTQYLHKLTQHGDSVKALSWCPFQSNLLASGAGKSDPAIRFWNTQSGACINSVQTHSKVCALQWSQTDREILSAHGNTNDAQICLWKYPTMARFAELKGHGNSTGHLTMGPDGTTVVSAGDDETLRFWRVFNKSERSGREVQRNSGLQKCPAIR